MQVADREAGPKFAGIDATRDTGGSNWTLAQLAQVGIPAAALAVGGCMLVFTRMRSAGVILGYFGAQSGISLYMKLVLSDATVSRELGMKGIPAAFLITGIQQVIAFVVMSLCVSLLWATPWRFLPAQLQSQRQVAILLLLSMAFAANIGLNNFSLSLVSISLNLVLRSCLPLVTLGLNSVMSRFVPGVAPKVSAVELTTMTAGVFCACLVTVAEMEAAGGAEESQHTALGALVCCGSIIAAAMDLILGGFMGQSMGMSPFDTTWYMSLPAALALLPPALLLEHPAAWPGHGPATDWQVLKEVLSLSPSSMGLILLSGVFSISYNLLRYAMVQFLSPQHTAFAGNFNKALTIAISICLGLERLPEGPWRCALLLSLTGSIAAFAAYGCMRTLERVPQASLLAKEHGTEAPSTGGCAGGSRRVRFSDEAKSQADDEEIGDA